MKSLRFPVIFLLLINLAINVSGALGQDDESCPAIVRAALAATHSACDGTGRNQACYGNITLEADALPQFSGLSFQAPGDIADVAGIQALRLSSMDELANVWGVALMRVQANLPDTMPGQNVTFLLFGDVEIENRTPLLTEIEATVAASGNINVRQGPSTNHAVVDTLAPGQTIVVDGRNATGDWLRFGRDDDNSAWVFAQLVTSDDSFDTLNVVEAGQPTFGPMQAFYFRSGIGDAPCDAAPNSGILVQTPQGAGEINLLVNEVNLTLGSTAYLQAQPDREMVVNVVEGQAKVASFDVVQTVPAGAYVTVPVDTDLKASGPPTQPKAYKEDDVESLPVSVLPEVVVIPEPWTPPPFTVGECVIRVSDTVDVRSGPSDEFPVSFQLVAGNRPLPNAQAADMDGRIWWQVATGSWVRADQVEATDTCASVPVVEVENLTELAPPVDSGSQFTIEVPNNVRWVDSGITLNAGQSFTVSASGLGTTCLVPPPNMAEIYGTDLCDRFPWTSPAGYPDSVCPIPNTPWENGENCLCASGPWGQCHLENAPTQALVGRVGIGAAFLIGAGGTFTADADGTLQLGANDSGTDDNGGMYYAVITLAGT